MGALEGLTGRVESMVPRWRCMDDLAEPHCAGGRALVEEMARRGGFKGRRTEGPGS